MSVCLSVCLSTFFPETAKSKSEIYDKFKGLWVYSDVKIKLLTQSIKKYYKYEKRLGHFQ